MAQSAGKAPTLYDVASRARVSHQTVSRLVKGETNIRDDLRERIEAAILELGYRPNLAARALASSRRNRIGAIVYDFLETGPSRIVKGASDGAREAGFLLDIVSLDPRDETAFEESISALNPNDLDGLLVIAPSDPVVELLREVGFSIPVYVETEAADADAVTSTTHSRRAMSILVGHLLEHGHRRFYSISGPLAWHSARTRESAYVAAVEAGGGTSMGSQPGDWSSASGYAGAMEMPLDAGITAVVAGNDQMALGVLAALAERGVRVPHEVSVVGFDDIPEARYFQPALTTVKQDFEQQGRVAVSRLLALITGEESPVLELAEPQLIARASSGPATQ